MLPCCQLCLWAPLLCALLLCEPLRPPLLLCCLLRLLALLLCALLLCVPPLLLCALLLCVPQRQRLLLRLLAAPVGSYTAAQKLLHRTFCR